MAEKYAVRTDARENILENGRDEALNDRSCDDASTGITALSRRSGGELQLDDASTICPGDDEDTNREDKLVKDPDDLKSTPEISPGYFQQDQQLADKIAIRANIWRAERRLRKLHQTSTALSSTFQTISRALALNTGQWKVQDLCFAIGALDIDKAARLIEEGVDLNADHAWGQTPLLAAIRAVPYRPLAQSAMIVFLLTEGADINRPSRDEVTPLSLAVELGHVELVRLLLERGANIHAGTTWINVFHCFAGRSMSAVHVAAAGCRTACLEVLLSHGASATATFVTSKHMKPYRRPEPKDDCQSSRDTPVTRTGVTALHLADGASARLLLDHGADVLARDSTGRTALHWAVERGDVEAVRLYLEKGHPVDLEDGDGSTGLSIVCSRLEMGAARGGFPDMVEMMLARGADVERRFPGEKTIRERWWMMEERRQDWPCMAPRDSTK